MISCSAAYSSPNIWQFMSQGLSPQKPGWRSHAAESDSYPVVSSSSSVFHIPHPVLLANYILLPVALPGTAHLLPARSEGKVINSHSNAPMLQIKLPPEIRHTFLFTKISCAKWDYTWPWPAALLLCTHCPSDKPPAESFHEVFFTLFQNQKGFPSRAWFLSQKTETKRGKTKSNAHILGCPK